MSTSHAIGRSTTAPRPMVASRQRPRTNRPRPADNAGSVLLRTWRVQPSRATQMLLDAVTWVLVLGALASLVFRQWFALAALGVLVCGYVSYVMWVASPRVKQRRARRQTHLLV